MKVIILISLFFLISCSHSPTKIEKPFLWVAKKDKQEMRLFGTVHIEEDVIEFPKYIEAEMKKTSVVYVEMTKSRVNKTIKKDVERFVKKFYSQADQPYDGLYSKLSKTAKKNVKYMFSHQRTLDWLDTMGMKYNEDTVSPAMVFITFMGYALKREKSYDQVLTQSLLRSMIDTLTMSRKVRSQGDKEILDNVLESLAYKNNLPVVSLDDSTIKVKLVDYLPAAVVDPDADPQEFGLKLVDLLFGNHQKLQESFRQREKLVQSYVKGDTNSLIKIMNQLSLEQQNTLLVERNKKWMKALLEQNEVQNLFVAVGVGHLIGKDSLISLLKKEGYSVRRYYPLMVE